MRKETSQNLNCLTCTEELTGADRICFDNFRNGLIVARGLPSGTLVENVGSFSRPVCKSILENCSSISFQCESSFFRFVGKLLTSKALSIIPLAYHVVHHSK